MMKRPEIKETMKNILNKEIKK